MAKPKKFDLEDPVPIVDDEDEETLAAIDEGIRDAEAGRVAPAEKVREDWLAIALRMQRDARANLSIERKRLQEILAQREGGKPILDNEDEETLAAIDEGVRDAEVGRVVPAEKAREIPSQPTASPSHRNIKELLLSPSPRFEGTVPKRGTRKTRPPIDLN